MGLTRQSLVQRCRDKLCAVNFEDYLADLPLLHSWDGGKSWNTGGFKAEHLRRLHETIAARVPNGASFIETGAGNSTLTFLQLSPSRVVSVVPDDELHRRVRTAATERGIDHTPLVFRGDRSEIALPRIAAAEEVHDVALIDGGHGWPTVFVDFCYFNMMLRKGGLLLIDDVGIYSVAELTRLLEGEDDYVKVEDFGKIQVWEKTSNRHFLAGHSYQPYIAAQARKGRWRRALRRLRSLTPERRRQSSVEGVGGR